MKCIYDAVPKRRELDRRLLAIAYLVHGRTRLNGIRLRLMLLKQFV